MKTKTFVFTEKNGSAIITLSAHNEAEANASLEEIVKQPEGFRLEEPFDDDEV